MNNPQMSPAQAAQQNNRTVDGKYTTKVRTEADVDVTAVSDYARTDVVIVDGGLVQNPTSLPVFDIDILSERVTAANVEDVNDLRGNAEQYGLSGLVSDCDDWLAHRTIERADSAWLDRRDVVVVEGGLVQNNPDQEVFDLDVFNSDNPDSSDVESVVELSGRASRSGLHEIVEQADTWLQDRNMFICDECGELAHISEDEVTGHADGAGTPDHDADADHVPFSRRNG